MTEEVLSDALLNALSKKIDIALYPASDFAVDLGFDFAAASAAEQHSFLTLNPQGKYVHLLKKFVDTHGRGDKKLIDIFKDKQKKNLVNFLEEAIKRQNALGQRQTGTNTNARNKSVWKSVTGLSVVVALLATVVACSWNNIFPEPRKCASSPCQNGGTCRERRGEYSCKCKTGYEGNNCEIEPRKCASSLCQNGGTCHDRRGGYSCTCKTGYGGSNCEIAVGCPRIISRSKWEARSPKKTTENSTYVQLVPPLPYAVVRHTVTAQCATEAYCKLIVRSIQNYHMDDKNWTDIGYNFLIGSDGNVYEGRGWNYVGAHTAGYNSKSLGIAMIGKFSSSAPGKQMLDVLDELLSCAVNRSTLALEYILFGHGPGDGLYNELTNHNNFKREITRKEL